MKRIIIGIFAHPDDEIMGPGGTLLLESRSGADLHLITFTDGRAGTNPDNLKDLGVTRLNEWRSAGVLLGAKTMHHLGYDDGALNNLTMIEATARISIIIESILKDEPTNDTEIELITLDLNGLTGHIDHIVAARTACHVFYNFKNQDPRFIRLRLFCLPADEYPVDNTEWIYMEKGRSNEEVDEVIDATALNDSIREIIRVHSTQRDDGERIIARQKEMLGKNHFIIKR